MRRLQNIFRLGIKELRILRRDPVLLVLVVYTFAGGTLIWEREHGTVEHLLMMPLHPYEIMPAKI